MTYSEQLEREAGQTRAQVERTLEELRTRMSPGQVVDQLVDYARDGGAGTFFRNLGRRTIENPLPVAVIGAGLAWLMISNGREHRARRLGYYDVQDTSDLGTGMMATDTGESPGLGERASSIASDASHRARDAAESVSDTARAAGAALGDMARRVSEKAHSTSSSLGDRAASAYSGASSGVRRATSAVAHSASHLGHGTMRGTRSFVDFCKDQPLLLAGLGLAVGAAIGAAFPATEVEQRLAGNEPSDQRNQAKWRLAHMGSRTEGETEHIEEVSSTGTTNGSGEHRRDGELGKPLGSPAASI